MGRLVSLVLIILSLAINAKAQMPVTNDGTVSSTTCPGTGCFTTDNIIGNGASSIQLSGTWTGTIQVLGSTNCSTYSSTPIQLYDLAGTGAASATTNGVYLFNAGSLCLVRITGQSAWTSGTATVTFRSIPIAAASTSSSGGGGGTTTVIQPDQTLLKATVYQSDPTLLSTSNSPLVTSTSGTITSGVNPNDRVTLTCSGVCASASMEFVGTGGPTGFLSFEVSTSAGANYFPLEGTNPYRTSASAIAPHTNFDVSSTTSGLWEFPLPTGTTNVRMRANSWSSGSWAILIKAWSLPAQLRQSVGTSLVTPASGPADQGKIAFNSLQVYQTSPQNGSAQADVITQTDAAGQPNYVPYNWTLPMWYNGATWDRARGTIANGGLVDVSRVQGTVTVAGTVVQGNAGTNAQAWWARIGDSTTGPVAVKGATTPPSATDKSLVVSLSPNSATPDPTPIQDSLFWDTTSPGGSSQGFNVAGYGTFTFFMQATSATGGVITITGSQTGNAVTLPIYEITSTGPVARTSLDISVLGTAERMYMIPVLGVEHVFFTLTSVITGGGAFVVVSTEANVAVWPEPLSSQGFKGTLTQSWWQQISDGTTGPVAVKAASTASIATDKALVVAVSPNNTPVLPSGAATSGLQTTGNTSLASIDTKLTNPLPVSAISLPLPTNAAIETGGNLASIKTNTDKLDVNLSTVATSANQTNGTQLARITNGTIFADVKGSTVSPLPNDNALVVTLSPNSASFIKTPVLPLPLCNPVRRTNCQPNTSKGF